MGSLVDGKWIPGWGSPSDKGTFNRPKTTFRERTIEPVPGRYHLYVSYACPWAHRTLITRALRGLEDAISVTVVDPHMGTDGWPFRASDPDPIGAGKTAQERSRFLRDVYLRADPHYTGRVTVPVLWDRERNTIVNNESREVMRMLDVDFAPAAQAPLVETLAPRALQAEIEAALDLMYDPINNGVYRAGFATSQSAYESAVNELFEALAHWDQRLSSRNYVCGDVMTEADIALFTTCLRFDLVYYSHFKCNLKRLRDHAGLWRFTRRMYAQPAIRKTCVLDEIKTHYYWSQENVNPTRIVPVGPSDYEAELSKPVTD